MSSPRSVGILVVEDDDLVRQTLVDILELNGYRVRFATNGVDGLSLAREMQPSLVVTDIEMPGMTGYELISELRRDERLRGVPVVIITAKVDRPSTRRGMELGADDCITKPFTEDEVLRSIQTRLEKKELVDELDAFAHTVAHDLHNPLMTLRGRLQLLEMELEEPDLTSKRRHLAEAGRAASRLSLIIEELLVLAGVRRQQVKPEALDMGTIAAEAVDRLEHLLKRTDATVTLPQEWPRAMGHPAWVVHLWSNYISNAAKYGGPKAKITLGAGPGSGPGRVRFWVRDQGPGISPSVRSGLFVPFAQTLGARATGHGLGLSIVRRIADKLGGDAGVETPTDGGARFWFELPEAATPGKHAPSTT